MRPCWAHPIKRDPKVPLVSARYLEAQAALSHIEVSKALLIIGIFMPKFAFTEALLFFAAGFSATGATSVARSHDPFSWERATEKNRST